MAGSLLRGLHFQLTFKDPEPGIEMAPATNRRELERLLRHGLSFMRSAAECGRHLV
jgi:hypothetical protein